MFADKLFVVAHTESIVHLPLDMTRVCRDTFAATERPGTRDAGGFLVLSREGVTTCARRC